MAKIKIKYEVGSIIGDGFTYIKEFEGNKKGLRKAWLTCKCGKEFLSRIDHVKQFKTKNCGCRTAGTKHGMHKESEYLAYGAMKARCLNVNNPNYHHYGGRGISICDRWLESFENFLEDLGSKPSAKHSLDRIDVNGNYELSNCRWATQSEQMRNTRSTLYVNFNGETKCISDWCEIYKISKSCFNTRMRNNWSIEDVFKYPTKKQITMFNNIGIKILPRDKNINLV